MTSILSFPAALAGKGPIVSMLMRINGARVVTVYLCVAIGTRKYVIFWQHAHRAMYRLTCSRMFGHGAGLGIVGSVRASCVCFSRSEMRRASVRCTPWCPISSLW